ncbi:MAG: hypothetical protein ONB48_15215 [candidate division KSB1 bacterium]|nr:hypothetical protein [candidate division KSB1 bacterium]MDZ7273413.1 hypothetical protein [candidate division KSB1 bacterium]MDZ7286994.1 hypothetical protein [candidate division KSB1 bacterium]MDZ7299653.1 hypothetical protein [candidate division KSB1 bacterium]MDZ7350770.1 hypothetical protein [candidate division KSB1 bacterium]
MKTTSSPLPADPPEFNLPADSPVRSLAQLLWHAHHHLRAEVRRALAQDAAQELAAVAAHAEMDTIFGIDTVAERSLLAYLDAHQHTAPAFVLAGEFESGGEIFFGRGTPRFRVLCDPIDGTRLVMYGKASGWILSAILPDKGAESRLAETIFSLQTEIPTSKGCQADTLWATPGGGAFQRRENLLTQAFAVTPVHARPVSDLQHSFITFVNLFPRGKKQVAALEEDFLFAVLGGEAVAQNAAFADQHLSTGGQIYALIHGQDRLVVDIRPQLNQQWRARAEPTVLCAHPYDLAGWLIAQEAGVVIRQPDGRPFDGPTHATAEIGWIGFASHLLAQRYDQLLLTILRRHGMI